MYGMIRVTLTQMEFMCSVKKVDAKIREKMDRMNRMDRVYRRGNSAIKCLLDKPAGGIDLFCKVIRTDSCLECLWM